ncbi:hypothetical protein HYDPIDRAFT_170945 [Hydnomerulius pinastri MD-312]|uniref:DUF6532 domain-containing protein n=1 Tax=Hydnomerulius pinastri MD-312 TaxID=994086 RepID=A0A0C9W885_9AGAM|nr:hypothetical protein HYDPIDRAFT_170945 [Hydnomerulius pinastri MD-312]
MSSAFCLRPPTNLLAKEAKAWVMKRADHLCQKARFLWGPPKANGDEENFANEAFYYGKSRKLLGSTAEFKSSIPYGGVVLVATAIKSVIKRLASCGHLDNFPKFEGAVFKPEYGKIWGLMEQVLDNEDAARRLDRLLAKWSKIARRDIEEDLAPSDDDEYSLAPMHGMQEEDEEGVYENEDESNSGEDEEGVYENKNEDRSNSGEEEEEVEEEEEEEVEDQGYGSNGRRRPRSRPNNNEATKRGFWPPLWRLVIDQAKLEWRVLLAVNDGFPDRNESLKAEIPDILTQCILAHKESGLKLEPSYYPTYKHELGVLHRLHSIRRDAPASDDSDQGYSSNGRRRPRSRPNNNEATKRGFWPPLWRLVIDQAKLEWRVLLAVNDGFPDRNESLKAEIPDILTQCILAHKESGLKLEPSYYPTYKHELGILIFQDASTFRSELIKLAIKLVPDLYSLRPPTNLSAKEAKAWVMKRADHLCQKARFLQGPPKANGDEENFANEAFYYGKSRKLLGSTTEFKSSIPYGGVVLVATAIKSVIKRLASCGHLDNFPKFEGAVFKPEYEKIWGLMEQVLDNEDAARRLDRLLAKWSKIARRDIEEDLAPSDDDEYSLAPMHG